MGQKVNPISFRLNVSSRWDSTWISNKNSYSLLLNEDYCIKKYLSSVFNVYNYLVGYLSIKWSVDKVFIKVSVSDYNKLKSSNNIIEEIEEIRVKLLYSLKVLFSKKNDIKIFLSVYLFDLYGQANIVAKYIKYQLEKGISFKKIIKVLLDDLKTYKNVEGIKVSCAGRLDGVDMARIEWIKHGWVPLQTINSLVDYGMETAYTIYGTCGIKVWIYYRKLS